MHGTQSASAAYGAALLQACGSAREVVPDRRPDSPALAWARSGSMALTGAPDGPPCLAPGPLAPAAQGALLALRALAGDPPTLGLDAAALLGERAAIFGYRRQGRIAPGGNCRLLRTADAWIALNLARPDDTNLLAAWLQTEIGHDPWTEVAAALRQREAAPLVERARLLSLPAAPVCAPDPTPPPWLRIEVRGSEAETPRRTARVVDLSGLWAGPLCAHLLQCAGARVVKVESRSRPDGARMGPTQFFDLLNGGKECVALDLAADRSALQALFDWADIVIESARPRALQQLGFDAQELVARHPGLTWVSITGYGRRAPQGEWVAFGDDAACAAGLAVATGDPDAPLFCGDAIADPLAGLHAAVAALGFHQRGGGALLDVSLRDTAAHALGFSTEAECAIVRNNEVEVDGRVAPVAPPRARVPGGSARALGADTNAVLQEVGAC